MIDVLSTNIQAHGSETAGPAASFRKAEFMPSSSSNSFAAYLDRISHSTGGNSPSQSDGYADYYQRDPYKSNPYQNDPYQSNDFRSAVGRGYDNNHETDAKEASYFEKNSSTNYRDKVSEESSEKTSTEVKSDEVLHESAADKDTDKKRADQADQADKADKKRADQADQADKDTDKKRADQADQADKDTDKKRAEAENREHSDNETRKNKRSSENEEKAEKDDELQQKKTAENQTLQLKELASEKLKIHEEKSKRENQENEATKKGDFSNTLSDQLKIVEKVVQDTSKDTDDKVKAEKAKVGETKAETINEAKVAGEKAKVSIEALEALKDKEKATLEGSSENSKTAAAADEVQSLKDLRAKELKIAEEGNSKEISLRKGRDGQHESPSGRETRGRRAHENDSRPRLTIIDKRGASAHNNNNNTDAGSGRQNSGFQLLSSSGNTASGVNSENSDSLQVIQVQLRGEGAQAPSSAQTGSRSADSGIRGQLQQQLQDHLNKDIVKRSSIMIRENGSGEIKLDLKPDTLGQVRIRITMENNHIAGKIFVENSNVKEAFDQNMQQLYRTFKEHGFENAALNVSVGDQGREQRERGRSHGIQPKVSLQQALALDEQSSSTIESSGELRLIDMMA